jgi:hypothetical protein
MNNAPFGALSPNVDGFKYKPRIANIILVGVDGCAIFSPYHLP